MLAMYRKGSCTDLAHHELEGMNSLIVSTVMVVTCRQEVYSCWSTASGARVNNYGARIDLILLAEPAIAGQPDAAPGADKPDVSSNIAFPVLASTQQQQSR